MVSIHHARDDSVCDCHVDETQTYTAPPGIRQIAGLDSYSCQRGRESIRPRWNVGVNLLMPIVAARRCGSAGVTDVDEVGDNLVKD